MSVVRARYEKGVLRLLDSVDLDEGEEVEVVIKRKVFGRRDYEELVRLLQRLPRGRPRLEAAEELYYEEKALR